MNVMIQSFVLTNANGVKMEVANFGARIVSLVVPDKKGMLKDVALGYDSLPEYLTGNLYFGATIGRYGNRIAQGKFSLNGKNYPLAVNDKSNILHGGSGGFHNVFWNMIFVKETNSVRLTYRSKNGEEGFPGNLNVIVTYSLTQDNEVVIDYEATTDEETIVNLTHHTFFNLAGAGQGDILTHELMLNADRFCAINQELIPTGELKTTKDTAFDFRSARKIGERINWNDEQLNFGNGYDHTWVLNKNGSELSPAAIVVEPVSGRTMHVLTTEPGVQFYSGNFLIGEIGKSKIPYTSRTAFCLETQHFPDSPNHAHFPSTVLKPNETYRQKTIYKFL